MHLEKVLFQVGQLPSRMAQHRGPGEGGLGRAATHMHAHPPVCWQQAMSSVRAEPHPAAHESVVQMASAQTWA